MLMLYRELDILLGIFWKDRTNNTVFFSYPGHNYPLVSRQRLSPSSSMDCKAQMSFMAANTKQRQNISGSVLRTLEAAAGSQVTHSLGGWDEFQVGLYREKTGALAKDC